MKQVWIILVVCVLAFVAGTCAQDSRYHWHMISYDRVNDDRSIASYGDGFNQRIVCNESQKGGDHAVAQSTSCVYVHQ